jgi:hypothetical protein
MVLMALFLATWKAEQALPWNSADRLVPEVLR